MYGLAKKLKTEGAHHFWSRGEGLNTENGSSSIKSVDTSHGIVSCDKLVVAPGPGRVTLGNVGHAEKDQSEGSIW